MPKPKQQTERFLFILCEGQTEKNYLNDIYFSGILSKARLQGKVNFQKTPKVYKRGQAELILNDALNKMTNKKAHVWCFIDGDCLHKIAHDDLIYLKRRIAKYQDRLFIALSVPCFEYWLLLHCKYSTRSFATCAESETVLKTIDEFKTYQKPSLLPHQDVLINQHNQAKVNAQTLLKEHQLTGLTKEIQHLADHPNPLTTLLHFFDYIETLIETA
jgi:hypothetical protein